MKTATKLWLGLGILVLISPLGLILPAHFKANDAWGEWGIGSVKELVGYIPRGLEKFSILWSAPIPDYTFRGWEEKGLPVLSFAYIISAIVGIIVVLLAAFVIGKMFSKKGD